VVTASFLALGVLVSPSSAKGGGGPDAFGYVWAEADSDFVVLDPGAGGAGMPLELSGPDQSVLVDLPWEFPFYGRGFTSAVVGENGGLVLDGSLGLAAENGPLPSLSDDSPDIAVFWDAIAAWDGSAVGSVLTLNQEDSVNRRFIVSWEGVGHEEGPGDASFQVHLFPNGTIAVHYRDTDLATPVLNFGGSATIGIQDFSGGTADEGRALEVSYNLPITEDAPVGFWVYRCLDSDSDGVFASHCGGRDCNDADPAVNPNVPEVPYDGIDNDCQDGDLDDIDGDGFSGASDGRDCDDADAAVNPDAEELCSDGIDNNCDGGVDQGNNAIDVPADVICGGGPCSHGGSPARLPPSLLLVVLLLVGRRGSRLSQTGTA